MIFCTAVLYPGAVSNISIYAASFGYDSGVKPALSLPAINGKLSMMSAPVRCGPQRYLPPSGEVLSCSSRKSKCVLKLGFRNVLKIFPETIEVMGLRKNGSGAFLISGARLVV